MLSKPVMYVNHQHLKLMIDQNSYCVVFSAAVKKNYPTTNQHIKDTLVNWFDGAKDRNGGRKIRAGASSNAVAASIAPAPAGISGSESN